MLEQKTLSELRAIAQSLGVNLQGVGTKVEIISRIRAATAAPAVVAPVVVTPPAAPAAQPNTQQSNQGANNSQSTPPPDAPKKRIPTWVKVLFFMLLGALLFWGALWLFFAGRSSSGANAQVVATATSVPKIAATGVPTQISAKEASGQATSTFVPDAEWNPNGNLPAYQDMRAAVREPGDTATFVVKFNAEFANVTLLRAVADDILLEAYLVKDGKEYDLLSYLKMGAVSETSPIGDLRKYMNARGVSEKEEQLAQNQNAVVLGSVGPGDYLVFEVRDDKNLRVNRGMLISLSADTDPFTVDLDGKTVQNPTFVLQDEE